jgi:ThiF family
MLHQPIDLKPDIQKLVEEGYEASIHRQHLLVESVPYVTPTSEIAFGTLVCDYSDESRPRDHTVWFKGETPCTCQGHPLGQVINHSNPQIMFDRFEVNHYFSNKPSNVTDFPGDYYVKMKHYIDILENQAKSIDPDVDARTGRVVESRNDDSVFRYGDTASARAGIVAISQKLKLLRIAIIGLGGTGGYILDQVAKTPVGEIHLFDGDDFKRHNAFRAPGAASLDQLQNIPKKVDYFYGVYNAMRTGIVCHPYHLDANNIVELKNFDFVFVSVDDGISRGLICNHLKVSGIAFIDVGMGLKKDSGMMNISGQCRTTLCTPSKHDHIDTYLDMHDNREEALYASNIQVADMNALNAMFAVIRWKQYFGFYTDSEQAHNLSFAIGFQSLARAETATGSIE